MRKIHVVLHKEALQGSRHAEACAIVLDIIFASSSITAALDAGARRILPALDFAEAQQISARLPEGQWVIAGEKNADPFPGCLSYDPLALSGAQVRGRDVVYATSNGTVALRRAAFFSQVYAASLRNGRAVAHHVIKHTESEDIVLICSGSLGRFSLEDFYGAGYLIQCLQEASNHSFICSDAALAAEMVWNDRTPRDVIRAARLGQLMLERGMAASLDYVSQLDCSTVVPQFIDGGVRDIG